MGLALDAIPTAAIHELARSAKSAELVKTHQCCPEAGIVGFGRIAGEPISTNRPAEGFCTSGPGRIQDRLKPALSRVPA